MKDDFMRNIGRGSSLHAELWEIIWALKRAWDMQWRRVIIETDCWEAVELLSTGWAEDHSEGHLVTEIRSWLDKEWQVSLDRYHRDANGATDALAKEALNIEIGAVFFSSPPSLLTPLLASDIA
ncbi:uncharacterized protein LOC114741465 [Neltuma alba]|uniref:uncharacterized protein LOC114741465 n=1 Tax=Neltuma alba TaxID=207710 RepID=UPI0010A52170|nr:uncharacterized protein LOC114741465 [Prosopis alba]